VVLDFHGYREGADIHARHSELESFGDGAGFVTLTPQGRGVVPHWDTGVDSVDLEFVEALLDAEEAALCIDTNRIYATGLSNGAFITSAVACALEGRIAAVAPVAGIRDPEPCEFDRPVPVVAFHGTDDRFVSFEGGLGPAAAALPAPDGSDRTLEEVGSRPDGVLDSLSEPDSVPELTAAWAERNGCDPEPTEEQTAEDVARVRFACPADATTELYRIDGGGHSWPGSEFSAGIDDVVGPTTFSIDADQVMWDFFVAHPRR
jgi:polyhydroxybutyrate depolymerase